MKARSDNEFEESGPAPGAEKMFANDPEMLALIKQAREEKGPNPRRKPFWWQLVLGGLGVLWAAAATVPTLLLDVGLPFHPLQPAAGLLGGMLLAIGILGHLPGRYRITDGSGRTVDESTTLWKPIGAGLRVLFCLAFLVLPALAYGLVALS